MMSLRSTTTKFTFLFLCVLIVLACGGGGGASVEDPNAPITNGKIRILWPARTRDDVPAPGSAMSAHVTLEGGSPTGANVEVFITRDDNVSLHYGEYPIGQPYTHAPHQFTSVFFSQPNQEGDIVGVANGTVNGSVWSDIVLDQSVKSVKILEPTTFQVSSQQSQMLFEADGAGNTIVAVTPGSAHWGIVSGSGSTLTPDGLITPSAAGSLSVKCVVDGISSPTTPVTVTEGQVDKVTYEDLYEPDTLGAQGWFVISKDVVGGFYTPKDLPVNFHAAFWVKGVRHDVNPGGATDSAVLGGSGGTGVGYATGSYKWFHGFIFTPSGATDIGPVGGTGEAHGISGSTVVGNSVRKACKWVGSDHKLVMIHPESYRESYATGIAGSTICGWATNSPTIPGSDALLWVGDDPPKVLTPSWSSSSVANAISGNTQVGYAGYGNDGFKHAVLWHGTADSAVKLQPSFAGYSEAYGCYGDIVVGWYQLPVGNDQYYRACIWNGSASKFIDLDAVLPKEYAGSSFATSVTAEEGGYTVVGYTRQKGTNRDDHLIIWHVPASLL